MWLSILPRSIPSQFAPYGAWLKFCSSMGCVNPCFSPSPSIILRRSLCTVPPQRPPTSPSFPPPPRHSIDPQRSELIRKRMEGSKRNKSTKSAILYVLSLGVIMLGATYCSVPIYKRFCQITGAGGSPELARALDERVATMEPNPNRHVIVRFTADRQSKLAWNFRPLQSRVRVAVGETALVFYQARNPTSDAITGIATYSVNPPEAALYFNKIQCFCFEEQRLNSQEEVDMPVLFYLDPEFDNDPRLHNVKEIVLSYTFFEAKEGLKLPFPNFPSS